MAQVQKLRKHDRLDPIDRFAQRFGLHPDDVFDNTSFDTVFAFLTKWHDQDEFHERFNYIWSEISAQSNIKPK